MDSLVNGCRTRLCNHLDYSYEKNISAQRSQAQTHTRIPFPHGQQKRSRGTQPPARQGPQTPLRLIRCPDGADGLDVQSPGNGFGKPRRLLNASDYSCVFDAPDARASHRNLLLLARRNDKGIHRLGLVIAKKNLRLAVQRNRVKRLAREFFRHLPPGDPGLDVVLLARRGLGELDNAELSSILQQQWQKLERHVQSSRSADNRES